MSVAVVGFGRMGRIHAAALAGDDRVDEIVVVDTDAARLDAARHDDRLAGCSGGLGAAIRGGCDAAVVATPAPTHVEVVGALLSAGVPTLCEKPLSLTVEGTRAVAALASQAPLQVGFQRRFDPAYVALAEACAARRDMGEIATLYRLASGDAEPPPADFLRSAGSILHDMLIHDLDVLRMLAPTPPVSVSARGSGLRLPPGAGFGTAVVAVELADGSQAVITGSRACGSYDTSASVTFDSSVVAVGWAGTGSAPAHVDAPPRPRPRWQGFKDRFARAYELEVRALLDVVGGAAVTTPGPAEALAALVLADAAAESAERGCRVTLPT